MLIFSRVSLFFNTIHFQINKYSFEVENGFIVQKSQAWDTLTIPKHFLLLPPSQKPLFNEVIYPNGKLFQL